MRDDHTLVISITQTPADTLTYPLDLTFMSAGIRDLAGNHATLNGSDTTVEVPFFA